MYKSNSKINHTRINIDLNSRRILYESRRLFKTDEPFVLEVGCMVKLNNKWIDVVKELIYYYPIWLFIFVFIIYFAMFIGRLVKIF